MGNMSQMVNTSAMSQGYQMPNSYANAGYPNYAANSGAVAELNAFKTKCQNIVDAFYKKLDEQITNHRPTVKRLEEENMQNYQLDEKMLVDLKNSNAQ